MKSLEFHRETSNKFGEGSTLANLGMVYIAMGDYNTAIKCLNKSLQISLEIGDKRGEGFRLLKLGIAYLQIEQIEKAETLLRKSSEIKDQLNDAGLTRALKEAQENFIKKTQ